MLAEKGSCEEKGLLGELCHISLIQYIAQITRVIETLKRLPHTNETTSDHIGLVITV